jgi:glycosyltransferase involved in cell wall biosynthesis
VNFAIAGQVAEWKGHELLVKAAELLVKDGIRNFNISIIGKNTNAYSEKLVTIIKEKKLESFFTWRGFIQNRSAIYNGIDVVVVPSMSTASKYFEESFSLSTAEGMIRGLAVIASNKGGMKELIDHNQNGLLFTEGDAAGLYACMKNVIANKDMMTYLGANALIKARANFTDAVMTDKYISVYNESHTLTNE